MQLRNTVELISSTKYEAGRSRARVDNLKLFSPHEFTLMESTQVWMQSFDVDDLLAHGCVIAWWIEVMMKMSMRLTPDLAGHSNRPGERKNVYQVH